MPRFLHLADIHLGFDRYGHPTRTRDFFAALYDVLQRYAIEPQVDFVVIAGDLFEHKNVAPPILNQAKVCLKLLQDAKIPVLAIEGNHDNRPYGTRTNWLRYLADWDWLILLEPDTLVADDADDADDRSPAATEVGLCLQPWDPKTKRGGYIDLDCGVRVLGSSWYGSTAPQAIEQLATAITQLPPGPHSTVMLFHHGMEGQIARYAGALRYSDVLPLRQAGVDYLAL
ncbi:MAG: metallophosphoesterase, partial [Cyanobacteria bacterium P01_H01_bin.121]